MERKVLGFAGRRLSYLTRDGEGTPVVFLHGMTNAATAWPSFFDAVAPRRCFALDFPGHGESDRFDNYGFDVDRDAVLALLDMLDTPVVLVGHSMGGLAAAAERPEAVRGVYLEDVTPLFVENPAVRSFALLPGVFRLPRLVGEKTAERHPAGWLVQQIGTFRHDERRSVRDALPAAAVEDWAAQAAGLDVERVGPKLSIAAPSTPPIEQLRRFSGPVHVAYGDLASGSMVPPGELDTMRTINPSLTATRFEGGGHLLHGQFPALFAADVASFIGRVDQAPT